MRLFSNAIDSIKLIVNNLLFFTIIFTKLIPVVGCLRRSIPKSEVKFTLHSIQSSSTSIYSLFSRMNSQEPIQTIADLTELRNNNEYKKSLKISSWNVLADSYSNGQQVSDESILAWDFRREKIKQVLLQCNSDIICLQEVDHFHDFYQDLFNDMNFKSIYVCRPTRKDGCLIAYNPLILRQISTLMIDFNYLATERYLSMTPSDRFLRDNIAIALKFTWNSNEEDRDQQQFVISTGHLYWNPNKPEVKLAQTVYWIDKLRSYASNGATLCPIIVTGDFNSIPTSEPYKYLTEVMDMSSDESAMQFLQISSEKLYGSSVKFLCDSTLMRLCKWLRSLGIDAAIVEDISNTKKPTAKDYQNFFDRARLEQRIILTTSRSLRDRASCPRSTLIRTQKLEDALVLLCKEYNIQLSKEKFLSVCGKCGGSIIPLDNIDRNLKHLQGKYIPDDREVFICSRCDQPYWWSEREDSSPARAMKVADRLYDYVSKKLDQIVIEEEIDTSTESVSSIKIDNNAANSNENSIELSKMFEKRNEYVNKISSSKVNSPYIVNTSNNPKNNMLMRSVMVCVNDGREPECTNWSGDFSGTLDYIFITKEWKVKKSKIYPRIISQSADEKSIRSNNIDDIVISNSQPSHVWPSDHFLLTTEVEL